MSEENKKSGGSDEQSVPPLKIQIVKDDEGDKQDSLQERDPLAGIDDIDIDKNRRDDKGKEEENDDKEQD